MKKSAREKMGRQWLFKGAKSGLFATRLQILKTMQRGQKQGSIRTINRRLGTNWLKYFILFLNSEKPTKIVKLFYLKIQRLILNNMKVIL